MENGRTYKLAIAEGDGGYIFTGLVGWWHGELNGDGLTCHFEGRLDLDPGSATHGYIQVIYVSQPGEVTGTHGPSFNIEAVILTPQGADLTLIADTTGRIAEATLRIVSAK